MENDPGCPFRTRPKRPTITLDGPHAAVIDGQRCRRHRNPDGSDGGWVSDTAFVGDKVFMGPSPWFSTMPKSPSRPTSAAPRACDDVRVSDTTPTSSAKRTWTLTRRFSTGLAYRVEPSIRISSFCREPCASSMTLGLREPRSSPGRRLSLDALA